MISEPEAREKVEQGWIKVWMAFEVLAVNENTAKDSLEGLIKSLDKNERIRIYKKDFGEVKAVEKPTQNIEKAYSITCDIELVSKKFEDIVMTVIEFGPSAIEILEPMNLDINAGEAQNVLNLISQMLHRFAAAGIGGMLLLKDKV